jgi:hypothetical protein
VSETRDAIADFEVLGDFGADLHDGAGVVAADGATFALCCERLVVDVLPVRRICLVSKVVNPESMGRIRLTSQ